MSGTLLLCAESLICFLFVSYDVYLMTYSYLLDEGRKIVPILHISGTYTYAP